MGRRALGWRALLALVLLLIGGQGCNLIAGLNDMSFGGGGSGGSGASTQTTSVGGTTLTTSGAGTTSSSGGSTTGGTGGIGGAPCQTPSDCPDPGNPCVTNTCVSGQCGTDMVPAKTQAGMQMTGDCKVFECNGSGTLEAIDDNSDLPVDGNDCTDDVCTDGAPSNPPVTLGDPVRQCRRVFL